MKVISIIATAALAIGSAQAATIDLAPTFAGSVKILIDGSAQNSLVQIGAWDTGSTTFTPFVTADPVIVAADASLAGSFFGTGPSSLEGQDLYIRVSDVGSTDFAILSTSQVFPAPLVEPTTGLTVTIGGAADAPLEYSSQAGTAYSGDNLNLVTVPEPSIALLGALGIFGLARRRR